MIAVFSIFSFWDSVIYDSWAMFKTIKKTPCIGRLCAASSESPTDYNFIVLIEVINFIFQEVRKSCIFIIIIIRIIIIITIVRVTIIFTISWQTDEEEWREGFFDTKSLSPFKIDHHYEIEQN